MLSIEEMLNIYADASDQLLCAVLLLHVQQLSLALFHVLLHVSQTLQQLLVSDGQGLMASDDGHNQRFRPVIRVILKASRFVPFYSKTRQDKKRNRSMLNVSVHVNS